MYIVYPSLRFELMGGGCVNMDSSKKKSQSMYFVLIASFAILSYTARVTAGKVTSRLAGSWSWKHCDSQFDQFLSFWALLLAIMVQISGFLKQIHHCWCCFLPSSSSDQRPKVLSRDQIPHPLALDFEGGFPRKRAISSMEWSQFGMKWPIWNGMEPVWDELAEMALFHGNPRQNNPVDEMSLLFTCLRLCQLGIRTGRPFIEQVLGPKWWKKQPLPCQTCAAKAPPALTPGGHKNRQAPRPGPGPCKMIPR